MDVTTSQEVVWGFVALFAVVLGSAVFGMIGVARERRKNDDLVRARDAAIKERDALTAERETLKTEREALRVKAREGKTADVVGFLSMLQVKGRFLDFLMDDITKYADAQVGAAARVVHQGCQGVVRDYFDIAPVCEDGHEGASMTLDRGYDAGRFRLLGRVAGEPPFKGRLLHRGWRTTSVRLPELTGDAPSLHGIIAPAEVELH